MGTTLNDQKTRMPSTKVDYTRRALNVIARYQLVTGVIFPSDTKGFCNYIIESTIGKSSSNFRQVKACCVYYARTNDLFDLAQSIEEITNDKVTGKSVTNNTSAQKKRFIEDYEEKAIHNHLLNEIQNALKSSYWNKPIFILFKAGLLVGLRPSEWQSSIILNEVEQGCETMVTPLLKVKNGKHSNGRAYAEYRYIGLSQINDNELSLIKQAILITKNPVNQNGDTISWNTFYKACSDRLYVITKRLFPNQKKRPTFYSCRHQCIANMKKAGYSLVEIACISGHLSDDTATEHYGKRRKGKVGGNLPIANEEDYNKIKKVFGLKTNKPILQPSM